jgi:hypothetical protein
MPPLSGRKSVQLSMSSEFGATFETGAPRPRIHESALT